MTKSETKRRNEGESKLELADRSGFTLIELILVMAMLTIAVAAVAPSLANFFRGRSLDSEARRVLALIRHGQSRAVSEGLPMELWVDATKGTFGLEAEPSYEASDRRAMQLAFDKDMKVEVVYSSIRPGMGNFGTMTPPAGAGTVASISNHPNLPKFRFLPDGSIDEGSPQGLRLIGQQGFSIALTQTRNRLSYEISSR